MKTFLIILALALSGCASSLREPQRGEENRTTMIRLDVSCILTPAGGVIVANCADAQTWKEWGEKQKDRERVE